MVPMKIFVSKVPAVFFDRIGVPYEVVKGGTIKLVDESGRRLYPLLNET